MAESEIKQINGRTIADITAREEIEDLKQYSWVSADSPLVLNADMATQYDTISTYGDKALRAIQEGRMIFIRTPNADGNDFTAIYSPVLMYQLPNRENNYLYLFYLRDEKQDLSALLGLPEGTVQMPQYGELQMLLSETYNGSPLGQPYINTTTTVNSSSEKKPVFFISSAYGVTESGYHYQGFAYYNNPDVLATVEEMVDAYMAGEAYFIDISNFSLPYKIIGFGISAGGPVGEVVPKFDNLNGICNNMLRIIGSAKADLDAAMAKYLP